MLKEFKDILGNDREINREPRKQVPLEERLPSEKAYQIGEKSLISIIHLKF